MTTFAVTSVNSLLCQASTCLRIGSKFRCIRSTPTEMQSMSEKDFECFASTGVNAPVTMFPDSAPMSIRFPRSRAPASLAPPCFNFWIARHSCGTRTPIPNLRAYTPLDLLSSSLHCPACLFNESCHSTGLRDVDGVAGLDLNDCGARQLGHGTLGLGWDHPVISGDQVRARLGPPRRFANCATGSRHAPRNLRIGHERCLFCVHVGRERGGGFALSWNK